MKNDDRTEQVAKLELGSRIIEEVTEDKCTVLYQKKSRLVDELGMVERLLLKHC